MSALLIELMHPRSTGRTAFANSEGMRDTPRRSTPKVKIYWPFTELTHPGSPLTAIASRCRVTIWK